MGEKGSRTQELIREAAFRLFAARGYSGVSMQELCTQCGLSKGGLYRYYDNKADVFLDLLRQMQDGEAVLEEREMAAGIPADRILDGFLERERAELVSDAPNLNIAVYEFCIANRDGCGPELLRAQFERGRELLLRLAAYGNDRGELHATCPEEAADAVLLLLEGMRMVKEAMPLEAAAVDGVLRQVRSVLGASPSGKESV